MTVARPTAARPTAARPTAAQPTEAQLRQMVLLDAAGVDRTLNRLAYEIVERTQGGANLALIGIRTGGDFLAHRLARRIAAIDGKTPRLGIVDITLYRDDFAHSLPRPEIGPTEIDFSLTGMTVVLVDDVLFTGRTIRSALDALMDHGRPNAIRLAVLVERKGHRELPIAADYAGLTVETRADEKVNVHLVEKRGVEADAVVLVRGAPVEVLTAPAASLPTAAKHKSKPGKTIAAAKPASKKHAAAKKPDKSASKPTAAAKKGKR